jgi:hypothetical protein
MLSDRRLSENMSPPFVKDKTIIDMPDTGLSGDFSSMMWVSHSGELPVPAAAG